MSTASGIVLHRIPMTTLYEPMDSIGSLLFLRWDLNNPPENIPINETWADSGPAVNPGYFVFPNAFPSASDATSFEIVLRTKLGPPVLTSLAWIVYTQSVEKGVEITINTLVPVTMGTDEKPVVATDVKVGLLAGMKALGFAAESPVFGVLTPSTLTRFSITYPPQPSGQPPNGAGIEIPLDGAGVGAFRFQGLTNANATSPPNQVLKSLLDVQIDPLRPLDAKRTYQKVTNRYYVLSQTANGYQITPA